MALIVGVMTVIVNIEKITADITANWVMMTKFGCGLPLLVQIIQITHGTCFSKMGMCTAAVGHTITMFVVSGRGRIPETAILTQRKRALLPAGLREAGAWLPLRGSCRKAAERVFSPSGESRFFCFAMLCNRGH